MFASPSLSTTTTKPPTKPKPVNVFSNDGSFLERFQRNQQEEQDRRKAEEALSKKKQFADRFKNRGKRPPDSPHIDLDPISPAKKPKRNGAPGFRLVDSSSPRAHAGRLDSQ